MRKVRALGFGIAFLAGFATNSQAQFPGGGSSRPISLVISGGMTVPAAGTRSISRMVPSSYTSSTEMAWLSAFET